MIAINKSFARDFLRHRGDGRCRKTPTILLLKSASIVIIVGKFQGMGTTHFSHFAVHLLPARHFCICYPKCFSYMYRSILISYSQKPDNCADHQTTMERTCLIIKRLTNPFCGDVQARIFSGHALVTSLVDLTIGGHGTHEWYLVFKNNAQSHSPLTEYRPSI